MVSVSPTKPGGRTTTTTITQDVHAPPEVVWGRIMDFPAYTRMVPRVTLCQNYKTQDHFLEVRPFFLPLVID